MRILVALSGGIDSSVVAYLLKKEGHSVLGITLFMWDEESHHRSCCGVSALNIARRVAFSLDIPHKTLDVRENFRNKIIAPFVSTYAEGQTPNPCALCNRFFKFGILFEKMKEFGCKRLATGHYARINKNLIYKAGDLKRDQSYFLAMLRKETLSSLLFPLGEMEKKEVKKLAQEANLPTQYRIDSQNLCFINGDYRTFLRKFMSKDRGQIIDKKGNVLATHRGIYNFTLGQRRGLGISARKPLYVTNLDAKKNYVMVGNRKELFRRKIKVRETNWFVNPSEEFRAEVKIRQAHTPAPAMVNTSKNDEVEVVFNEPQFAPTPGQLAVLYKGEKLIGGGWIKSSS